MATHGFWSDYDRSIQSNLGLREQVSSRTGARHFLERLTEGSTNKLGTLERSYEWVREKWKASQYRDSIRISNSGLSAENWILRSKHTRTGGEDLFGEVDLELEIARVLNDASFKTDHPLTCGNAVAASSGLFASKDGFCQIDLVHICADDEAEIIELKYKRPQTKFGVELVVGAAFQVAKYALLLTLFHAEAHKLGCLEDGFVKKRPLLSSKSISLKTLANESCYERVTGEFENGLRGLRALSEWLQDELNAVALKHPSEILGRQLAYQHSFHAYPDAAADQRGLPPNEVQDWLQQRVDIA